MTVITMYSTTVETAQRSTETGIQNSPASPVFATPRRRRAISSGDADLDVIFDTAGRKFNISPNLLKAVAKVESNFKADLVSKTGAMGIMQLMPGTVKYLGIEDPLDPEQNIMGGAKYIKEQLDRFSGNIELALAAYNAGWPTVVKHGGIPPFRETQAYVPKVLSYMGGGNIASDTALYNGYGKPEMASYTQKAAKTSASAHAQGTPAVKTSTGNTTFDFHEALAQMLFIKMIEMQMNTPGSKEETQVIIR